MKNQELREELRLKMIDHENKAREYRKSIEKIDLENDLIKIERKKSMIGKCFQGKLSWEYFRIDSLSEDYQYIGTEIHIYSEETNSYSIQLNQLIYDEYVDEGKEISTEEFDYMIRKILCFIRLTND